MADCKSEKGSYALASVFFALWYLYSLGLAGCKAAAPAGSEKPSHLNKASQQCGFRLNVCSRGHAGVLGGAMRTSLNRSCILHELGLSTKNACLLPRELSCQPASGGKKEPFVSSAPEEGLSLFVCSANRLCLIVGH